MSDDHWRQATDGISEEGVHGQENQDSTKNLITKINRKGELNGCQGFTIADMFCSCLLPSKDNNLLCPILLLSSSVTYTYYPLSLFIHEATSTEYFDCL